MISNDFYDTLCTEETISELGTIFRELFSLIEATI